MEDPFHEADRRSRGDVGYGRLGLQHRAEDVQGVTDLREIREQAEVLELINTDQEAHILFARQDFREVEGQLQQAALRDDLLAQIGVQFEHHVQDRGLPNPLAARSSAGRRAYSSQRPSPFARNQYSTEPMYSTANDSGDSPRRLRSM